MSLCCWNGMMKIGIVERRQKRAWRRILILSKWVSDLSKVLKKKREFFKDSGGWKSIHEGENRAASSKGSRREGEEQGVRRKEGRSRRKVLRSMRRGRGVRRLALWMQETERKGKSERFLRSPPGMQTSSQGRNRHLVGTRLWNSLRLPACSTQSLLPIICG